MKYLLTWAQISMMRVAEMKVKNILHNTLLQNHLKAKNRVKMRINNRLTMKINTHVVIEPVVDVDVDVVVVAVEGLHKKTELPDVVVGEIGNKKIHC